MELTNYLYFNGQCEEAFKFYAQCLGGKIEATIPYEDAPGTDQVPPEWRKKLMHARMTIGNQILMASDAPPDHYQKPQGFSVSIGLKDTAEGKRIFDALAENGKVIMPFGPTFWAKGFAMFADRFGIPWMINCD
jgi:PhnB protein